jgi:hypothetical protein
MSQMHRVRRRGAPCVVPYVSGVVVDGQVIDVPRGAGFEVPDGAGGFTAAPGWEFVETEEPAAVDAGGEDGER